MTRAAMAHLIAARQHDGTALHGFKGQEQSRRVRLVQASTPYTCMISVSLALSAESISPMY